MSPGKLRRRSVQEDAEKSIPHFGKYIEAFS
jgi:hypothetical protein